MTVQFVTKRRSQLGLTLVELMIALALSIFLAGGIVQIFVGNRVTFAYNDGLSRIQENARLSLEQIAFTSRMAGHSGCLAEVGVFNNLAGAANDFRDDIAGSIQGHDANGTGVGDAFAAGAIDPAASTNVGNWAPALPTQLTASTADGNTPGVIPGSDVLVVRGATGATVPLVAPFNDATQLFVPTTHGFTAGEILVVADCQKASLFQLTSTGTVGAVANLVHNNGGFTPGNTSATWPAEQDYGLSSEISRLQTYAFYVGRGGSGRPSLFQMRLQPDGSFMREELAEGIDSMQIRYGVDGDNDGDIDTWATADAIADWTAVLSIEVTLLARSADEYGTDVDTAVYNLAGTQFDPTDDRRLRQVFSTTIGLRNRLP